MLSSKIAFCVLHTFPPLFSTAARFHSLLTDVLIVLISYLLSSVVPGSVVPGSVVPGSVVPSDGSCVALKSLLKDNKYLPPFPECTFAR